MSLPQKIFTAISAVVALDASGLKCVYPDILPQNPTYPAVTYQVISSSPGPVTPIANVNDFRVQVTMHSIDYAGLETLRAAVLGAIKAMPEYVTYDELPGGFEFEPKVFSRIIDFHFRDTET
jgi:hypothetical protein